MQLILNDCKRELLWMKDNSIDSVVTDPPYELKFMGKKWDGSGIAYDVEMWKEVLRVLKPGGHLLSFGATRTHHRMMVAIEDAGFEIRDCLMWMYGTGFPKNYNISKAIDKAAGAEREVVGQRKDILLKQGADLKRGERKIVESFDAGAPERNNGFTTVSADITAPATLEAEQWEGWGTALKPAYEPIVLARKPLAEKTIVANVLEYGVGGINIDESRVGTEGATKRSHQSSFQNEGIKGNVHATRGYRSEHDVIKLEAGRFPANVLFTHHSECKLIGNKVVKGDGHAPKLSKGNPFGGKNDQKHEERYFNQEVVEDWICHEECPIRILDSQSGILKSGKMDSIAKGGKFNTYGKMYERRVVNSASKGGASRFFYCAKASKSERNAGLDSFPDKVAKVSYSNRVCSTCGKHELQTILDRRCLCENPTWETGRLKPTKNTHPTVKPLKLMEYLVKLITPPNGTVLDPFMGSGSTGCACATSGFNFIGIELEKDSHDIAKKRIEYYENLNIGNVVV